MLTIAVEFPRADAAHLLTRGALDVGAEGPLLDALAQVRGRGARTAVIDLGGLSEADGSGLTALFKLAHWCRSTRVRLAACGVGTQCRGLLRELGLEQLAGLYPSWQRALGLADGAAATVQPVTPCRQWAGHLGRVRLPEAPGDVQRELVDGLPIQTPATGFGQLWHKVYELRLPGVAGDAGAVTTLLRTQLGELWPEDAQLYVPPPGLEPGAVGVIRIRLPGGGPLVTGVRVLHIGETSFTFVTLQGHMQAGWITFGARQEGAVPVARVESFARTGDPVHDLGFWAFGHTEQERFWSRTLTNLGARLGVTGQVVSRKTCVDHRRNWAGIRNLTVNAAARTGLHAVAALWHKAPAPRRNAP